MTTADFDARLTRLEDIEEIKQLKARYCAYCDDGYDPNGIAALFTEDGIWDGGRTFGKREGRDAIHRHFEAASQRISIARHQVMNPIITVDGDEATADWLLFQPCTTYRRRRRTRSGAVARCDLPRPVSAGRGNVDDFGDGDRRRVLHTLRLWLGEATILARTRTVTPPPLVVRGLRTCQADDKAHDDTEHET